MAQQLTAADARQSLTAHVAAKGIELFVTYGAPFGWDKLQRLLADTAFVRYPCEIVFNAGALLPGECAYPQAKGARPEDGFTLFVHPAFMHQRDRVAWLVLYQLVAVNYGEFASAEDAETFGAAALGLTRDEYYAELCRLADQFLPGVPDEADEPATNACAGPGSCTCG
jgi:hypothetical protein